MKIAFTLCSNNYLAYARSLGESFLYFNPDYTFYIGLVDRKSESINYSEHPHINIIAVEEIGMGDVFYEMFNRYNIVELNTSVKPFYFQYFFDLSSEVQSVIYLDPDILVYDKFTEIESQLLKNSIVLTPHILSPIPLDNKHPNEQLFTIYGTYNLGFLALKRSGIAIKFLKWWSERLAVLGFDDPANGLFVDQLWINLVPAIFDEVTIYKNPGANAAFWNLHEREFKMVNSKWVVNNEHRLLFFHFSAFQFENTLLISKYCTRYDLSNRPELRPLLDDYRGKLKGNQYEKLRPLTCYFVAERKRLLEQITNDKETRRTRLKTKIKRLIPKRVKNFLAE
jgi:hypothetical protein